MRTVSFSDPRVQNLFNQKFVNTHTNTEGDPTSGQSIRHRPGEPAGHCIRGNGKQNIQTIFLTPAGEIFHAATGYLSADDLLAEARFALKLFEKLKNVETSKRSALVSQAHRDRLTELGMKLKSPDEEMIDMAKALQKLSSPEAIASNSRNPNDPSGMFGQFSKRQFRQDQQFAVENPSITYKQLEQNPSLLVGNGQSFFASSSSGNNR